MAAVVSKLSFALGKQLFISCQASFCKVKKPLAKLWPYTFLPSNKHWGPLHIVWQVFFWLLNHVWFISSWQNFYKSVFFPKAEWSVAELSFCRFLRPELSGKWRVILNTYFWWQGGREVKNPPKPAYVIHGCSLCSMAVQNSSFRWFNNIKRVLRILN